MLDFRLIVVGVSAASLVASCSASVPGGGLTEGATACTWPTAADTFDADAGEGCSPHPTFDICEVPSGSNVHADGGITLPDGSTAPLAGFCKDWCLPTEYALTCKSTAPDPSLACDVIPIPTPVNTSVWCCPCAR